MGHVYIIENIIKNKFYVGATAHDPTKRWAAHLSIARKVANNNTSLKIKGAHYIHNALSKHIDNLDKYFSFYILQSFSSKEEAFQAETYWIDYLKSNNCKLYNLTEGGENPPIMCGENNPFHGKNHTEETKKYLSEINKGKCAGEKNYFYDKHFVGEEHALFNSQRTDNVKEALSAAHAGKVISEELKQQWSESRKGILAGEKNPNFGKRGELSVNAGIFDKTAIEIYNDYHLNNLKRSEIIKKYNIHISTYNRVISATGRFTWLKSEKQQPDYTLKSSKTILSKEIIPQINDMYRSGLNYRQIADILGVQTKTLIGHINRFKKRKGI